LFAFKADFTLLHILFCKELAKELGIKETGLKRNDLADKIRTHLMDRRASRQRRGFFQDVTNGVNNDKESNNFGNTEEEDFIEAEEEDELEDKENENSGGIAAPSTSFFESISNATKSFGKTFLPPYKTMDAMIDLELKA
jgi:hypothetical protein